ILQDLHQFRLLKIEPPLSPQKSLSPSPRKRSLPTIDTDSPAKCSRQVLESPSTDGLFNSDADEDFEDKMEDQLLSPWLPPGRKM
ncbi:unnamed protein product, partial [Rotaria sordida]